MVERMFELLILASVLIFALAIGAVLLLRRRAWAQRQADPVEVDHSAYDDALTGLPNKEGLKRDLRQRAAFGEPFAFLYVDLDRFLSINQTYGQEVADDLLRSVAARLQAAREPGETIARIGADQFIILAPLRDPTRASSIGKRFNSAVDGEPYRLGADTASVTASIGLALFPFHGRELGVLMGEAETAVYQAKFAGGGRCVVVRNNLLRTSDIGAAPRKDDGAAVLIARNAA